MAEHLWGVRFDEVEGEHLSSLDIGLPLEALLPLLRGRLGTDQAFHEVVTLDAVNRRGRAVTVQVTVSRLSQDGGATPGALLMMDVVEPRQE
jgi:two-component system CheB/CheR fusion protein